MKISGTELAFGKGMVKPVEQVRAVSTLNMATGLADGDNASLLDLESASFLIEEKVGKHDQGPEALDGSGAHELIMVEAEEFLDIGKELFHIPALGNVGQQGLGVSVQVA